MMREEFFRQPLYWASRGVMGIWLWLKYRLRVRGRRHVPRRGGLIVAANHCSYLDPPIMAVCAHRRVVHFMARDTLLSIFVARWFFRRVGVIPLDRTRGDLGALRKAIATLKEDKVVGLFPEGTRSPDGRIRTAKGGIGFLIAKSGVPVVPLHIAGSFEAFPKGASRFRKSRISARFGPVITPEEIRAVMPGKKSDYEAVGALVMERIRQLAPGEPGGDASSAV